MALPRISKETAHKRLLAKEEKHIGQTYGRWTVGNISHKPKWKGDYYFHCTCSCGTISIVSIRVLQKGKSLSCGCYRKEICSIKARKYNSNINTTNSKEYRAWCSMKSRCLNQNVPEYKYYGGRGIKVCDKWIISFSEFLNDVGYAPTSQHTLDRFPDNNGNYEPSNCQWRTRVEQAYNKRSTLIIIVNGVKTSVDQLHKETGIPKRTLNNRFHAGDRDDRLIRKQTHH